MELYWLLLMIALLALLFLSTHYLDSQILSVFIFFLIISPFIFFKRMMKIFTRKAIIKLEPGRILIEIDKLNTDQIEMSDSFDLNDIETYQIQFPNKRFACLILKLTSGKKHEFSFLRQRCIPDNSEIVIKRISKLLNQHQVEFAPSFLASKKGLYTIIFLLVILSIPFGLAIELHKNLPLTIFTSIALAAHIISRRIIDLRFYNKWKDD